MDYIDKIGGPSSVRPVPLEVAPSEVDTVPVELDAVQEDASVEPGVVQDDASKLEILVDEEAEGGLSVEDVKPESSSMD